VFAGEADVAGFPPEAVVNAVAGGAPVVMVGSLFQETVGVILGAPAMGGLRDLKAKIVAVRQRGGVEEYGIRRAPATAGLTGEDVSWLTVLDSSAVLAAVEVNQAQACFVAPPFHPDDPAPSEYRARSARCPGRPGRAAFRPSRQTPIRPHAGQVADVPACCPPQAGPRPIEMHPALASSCSTVRARGGTRPACPGAHDGWPTVARTGLAARPTRLPATNSSPALATRDRSRDALSCSARK
jgi:NMT1/THI5 like